MYTNFIVVGHSVQTLHPKLVVPYQFEYVVQDEVGGYITAMHFHAAMVNKK